MGKIARSKLFLIILLGGTIFLLYGCKKDITLPTISTAPVSEITDKTAITGGNIKDDGGAKITARGLVWVYHTGMIPTLEVNEGYTDEGAGKGKFSSTMNGLYPNMTYYVASYATNSVGTAYGEIVTFTTNLGVPLLITTPVSAITIVSGQGGGVISSIGGATGPIVRGVCWDTKPNPNAALSTKFYDTGYDMTFTIPISRLKPGTTYSVRAFATNNAGTGYGNEVSFTTKTDGGAVVFNPNLTYGTVDDNEGNTYKTISIGTQTWMAENLKATKYRNGDLIGTTVPDTLYLYNIVDPKYQWAYNGDENLMATYGRLYTWYTVNDSRNLCPTGWHVPTLAEWTTLIDYLGGVNAAGGKLKESGLNHWYEPNTAATNESGFTALPGGHRWTGDFSYIIFGGSWWSSLEENGYAWSLDMHYAFGNISKSGTYKKSGRAVRCVKD